MILLLSFYINQHPLVGEQHKKVIVCAAKLQMPSIENDIIFVSAEAVKMDHFDFDNRGIFRFKYYFSFIFSILLILISH